MEKFLKEFPRPDRDNGRGVHGPPGTEPKGFLTQWSFWKEQLQAMNIRWLKILDAGDGSALPLAEKLMGELGIMVVVRFYREKPNPGRIYADREVKTAQEYVKLGVPYFETNNEPDLSLEWADGKRPPNWLDIVVDNFIAEADMIRNVGGYLLFPAFGPGGRENPFEMIVERGRKDLLDGNCALAIHNYCLGRPLDYPNDPVTLYGQPITKEQWAAEASDKKILPGKMTGPLWAWEMGWEQVNEYRKQLANPNANIMQDSTCFRAFEYFNALVIEACGHSIPIFTTEGGYSVGQRAGTTAGDDPRWPKPSPQRTAEMTLEMFDRVSTGPDYYFSCMPWLLANYAMGYWQPYFEHQSPWFSRIFQFDWHGCDDGQLPVVQLLKDNPGSSKEEDVEMIRKPGLWGANGDPGKTVNQMLDWGPGSLTCIFDYLQDNKVFEYKRDRPNVPVILRFMHPQNWHVEPEKSARDWGREVAGKWNDIKILDPYVYFANEMNLHYENGDKNPHNQHLYQTPAFYEKYANWVRLTAETIKDIVPDMKIITPPFAFGHDEDGVPENGIPTIGWAGYDFLADTVRDYFDNILTFHAYWPSDGGGENLDRLYDPEISSWYAFRWRRLLELFENQYGIKAKVIIDECGNFEAGSSTFTDQVEFYSRECLKDPRVLALTWFLWLDPTNSPGNVPNSWVQQIADLPQHLNRLKHFSIDLPDPDPDPDPDPEPPPEPGRVVFIERGPGLPLIVGDWGKPGKELALMSPSGRRETVPSGSKVDFGPGGFEFYATEAGDYLLRAEGQEFVIPMAGEFTRLTFEETGEIEMVVMVSSPMGRQEAEALLVKYPELAALFKIQEA